ncbi:nucleotide exchange factor GrpE [Mycoplasmatota bacterium]|nr:nucleotide exchange factor GrpE [Mycoplasmatota bacterium]
MTVKEDLEKENKIELQEFEKLRKERDELEKKMKSREDELLKIRKEIEEEKTLIDEEKKLIDAAKTEVKDKIDVIKLRKETQEIKDKMLRDRAELENFKRRSNEERIRDRKYAQQFILSKLIDMQDNLERALQSEVDSIDKFKEGVVLIQQQLGQIIEGESVKEIEALHKEFDPNYHQAVFTENNEEFDDDIVLEVLQKGYLYKERVLRPSMVKVNKKEN